ncbi:hypothetical protein [Paenibacillus sp. J22TS3]|uniref:hypothetical protein n=1 Tax=Paenibacillus sp. J22TS3 TaxID=2807192 RepID=UPI001B03EEE1|nr:hypothetical protein [Paenibacillus sp. J22TS3]GIP21640.1 hypothetical protein J22TS3_19150 [Paenibacillus sp. J22TS3]
MKKPGSRISSKTTVLLTGLILAMAVPGTGYASAEVPVIENSTNNTSNVVITFPGQPNTGGDYTVGGGGATTLPSNPGIPDVDGVGNPDEVIISFPGNPGGIPDVGGVKNPDGSPVTQPDMLHFTLDSDEYSVTVGDTLDTAAYIKIGQGPLKRVTDDVVYISERPDLLQVDSQGNLTGLKPGLARVTALHSGKLFTAKVLVVNPYQVR